MLHYLELPFVEALTKGERYVVLVRLSDYFQFISDDGKLRRYLFDSNVRDFMGLNRVNEDIKSTLEGPPSPDFWWLNNGVTMLATGASIVGKSIQVSDIQIVNGLQTTESIFRHFSSTIDVHDDRSLLVKVIVSKDEAVRDSIIRATNNQTDVELASLHATDKIQRDIEDALARHGFFYERRKNYYINLGHKPAEIVTPLYLAAGYVALVLKLPAKAATLRSKFMRSPESYAAVFSDKAPIDVWPKVAHILKAVDAELEKLRPQGKGTEKFLKNWRYILALLLISEAAGKFNFSTADLVEYDTTRITSAEVNKVWDALTLIASSNRLPIAWTIPNNVVAACKHIAKVKGISGIEMLASRHSTLFDASQYQAASTPVSDEFIEKVWEVLPPQPWKPGLHKTLSAKLGCATSMYFAAVERLIENGRLYRQKDGVLYDQDGNIVAFDPQRVDPATFRLLTDT